MSDPTRPDDPNRAPIADAASLFDSNVVQAYNPASESPPAPKQVAPGADEYGIDLTHAAPSPPPRTAPPRPASRPAARAPLQSKPTSSNRHFDPTDDDASAVKGSSSHSHTALPGERKSQHIDAESDSSDRAPARSKRRSSDRAIGFEDADDGDAIVAEEDLGDVDPIWTRGAEWGSDLVRVGVVGLATLVAAWFMLGVSGGLTFLVLAIGGAACVLLSYPIAITIERPVRITPEQAVTDFFAAASHHIPHYRRMWLLLSPAARQAGRFTDFGEFRANWRRRIAGWKEGRGGKFTPLSFQIGDFRGDKSVGLTTSHVEYTVQVFVRGQEAGKPINSYRMSHGVVKGPDRMWYLNQGALTSGGR